MNYRTDLAIESKRLWENSVQRTTQLSGVKAWKTDFSDVEIDVVKILDEYGSKQLDKPIGTYSTINLDPFLRKEPHFFQKTSEAIAHVLQNIIKEDGNVLVVGLGNSAIAADAVGPKTVENLVVTRHLKERNIAAFAGLSGVSAICTNVLGKTGIESAEMVQGIVAKVKPKCIIAVDALASCEPDRLCHSVQISNTGIHPGSGIGNHRIGITKENLGVPVYAIGVPTIVDGTTFLALHGNDRSDEYRDDLVLTCRDIDVRVKDIGKVIGYGINLALHPVLSFHDIPVFVS